MDITAVHRVFAGSSYHVNGGGGALSSAVPTPEPSHPLPHHHQVYIEDAQDTFWKFSLNFKFHFAKVRFHDIRISYNQILGLKLFF